MLLANLICYPSKCVRFLILLLAFICCYCTCCCCCCCYFFEKYWIFARVVCACDTSCRDKRIASLPCLRKMKQPKRRQSVENCPASPESTLSWVWVLTLVSSYCVPHPHASAYLRTVCRSFVVNSYQLCFYCLLVPHIFLLVVIVVAVVVWQSMCFMCLCLSIATSQIVQLVTIFQSFPNTSTYLSLSKLNCI